MEPIFNRIYQIKEWGTGSGPGSNPVYCIPLKNFLIDYIKTNQIKSLVDLGCGDMQWMPNVIKATNVKYTGIDCVSFLIENHKLQFPDLEFIHSDIFADVDSIPPADLYFIKDMLQHHTNEHIEKWLDVFFTKYPTARLITCNCWNQYSDERNIPVGGFHPLDGNKLPFLYFRPTELFAWDTKKVYLLRPRIKNPETRTLQFHVPPRDHKVAANLTIIPTGLSYAYVPIMKSSNQIMLNVYRVDEYASANTIVTISSSTDPTFIKIIDIHCPGYQTTVILDVPFDLQPVTLPSNGGLRNTRVIHQTFPSQHVSPCMYNCVQILLDLNPDYEYRFYDDKGMEEYIINKYGVESAELNSFQRLIPGAYKADLFRYAVMFHSGGAYMDIKQVWLMPLDILWKYCPELPHFTHDQPYFGPHCIYQAFIASEPGYVGFQQAISKIVDNVSQNILCDHSLAVTGPVMLGRLLQLSEFPTQLAWVPSHGFYLCFVHLSSDKSIVVYRPNYPGYYSDRSQVRHYDGLWKNGKIYHTI